MLRWLACATVVGSVWQLPSTTAAHRVTAAPSVRTRVEREAGSTDAHTVLTLHVDASGFALGSYQGTMTFDPAVLVVDSVSAGRDGFRFVNPNAVSKGSVRFAGFTATGFVGTDAVRLVAHRRSSLEKAALVVTLEVAGDVEGRAIAKRALMGSSGIEDARPAGSGRRSPESR